MKRFLLFLTVLFLTSCNQGGTDPPITGNESTLSWIVPGIGTTYVFQDSISAPDSLIVVMTGQTRGGKSNVYELLASVDDTEVCHIESNGDFSFGNTQNLDSDGFIDERVNWSTYPTGSQLPMAFEPTLDSTDEFGDRFIRSDSLIFVGTEMRTVPAGTFSTYHLRQNDIDDEFLARDTESSFSDTFQEDIWFAPAVGFYVQAIDRDEENGFAINASDTKLIRYAPK